MGATRRIDYTNVTFNKLTGIKYLYTTSGGNAVWLWQCECGKTHEAEANNVKRGHVTSCGCYTKSLNEIAIDKILKENDFIFQNQYSFVGELIGEKKKCLCFDFGVLDQNQNLIYLIEYDGEQHFKPVTHWGGIEGLIKRHNYDIAKNNWCEAHNIPLIRIPYTHKKIVLEDIDLATTKFIYSSQKEKEYYKPYYERKDMEE